MDSPRPGRRHETAVAARTGARPSRRSASGRVSIDPARTTPARAPPRTPTPRVRPKTRRARRSATPAPSRSLGPRPAHPGADRVLSPAELLNAVSPSDLQSATAEIPAAGRPRAPHADRRPVLARSGGRRRHTTNGTAGRHDGAVRRLDGSDRPGAGAASPGTGHGHDRAGARAPNDRPGAHPGGCRPGAHPPGDARFRGAQAGTGSHPGREPGAGAFCGSRSARALVAGTSGGGTGAHPGSRCRYCAGRGPGHRRAHSRGDAAARGRGPGE